MATWIVGGALAIIVGAIVFKMVRDKRNGKGGCTSNCGGCGGVVTRDDLDRYAFPPEIVQCFRRP